MRFPLQEHRFLCGLFLLFRLRRARGGVPSQDEADAAAANRQALRALRKSYIDKVRAFLTDEQKTKLDDSIAHAAARGGHAGPNGGGNTPPPPPAPAEK